MRQSLRQALFCAALAGLLAVQSALAAEVSEGRLQEVGYSKQWRRLLHYGSRWFGGDRSRVDGPGFFFSPNGAYDPVAELKASLEAMDQNLQRGMFKLHPQCAFPERYRFLKEKFGAIAADVPCPKLDEFLQRFQDPQAISLIFSSAYPNNPASMFGHTFLRVHSKRHTDLLDYGINFAAQVSDDEPGLQFMYFGLTGGYRGSWSALPYYTKVNEYVNSESRDLWEYELSLSPEETRRLIHHLWELETNSYFEYYFFDENCSFQILAALEAIRPDWNLLEFSLGLLPGESVKNITSTPGAVRTVRYRPSLNHQFFHTYNALTRAEKREFTALIERHAPLTSFHSRVVLDAGIGYLDYLSNEHRQLYKDRYEEYRKELLSYRATLGPSTEDEVKRIPPLEGTTRPDLGHDAYNIRLGAGYRGEPHENGYNSLQLWFPYHDLLNNDLGYTRYAHIQFPGVEFQVPWRKPSLRVERVTFLATTSLMPFSTLDKRLTWRFDSGLYTARDYGCDDCRHVFAEGGLGSSLALGDPRNLLYGLALFRPEVGRDVRLGYRLLPGLEAGLMLNPVPSYKTRLNVTHYWNLTPRQVNERIVLAGWQHAFFPSRNWEIRQTTGLEFADGHTRPHVDARLETIFFYK